VLQAIKELDYRPNAIARSMVKGTSTTVGLIMSEVSPLFDPVGTGVEQVLTAEGFQVFMAHAQDYEDEEKAIETFRSKQVNGFIFMHRSRKAPYDNLLALKEDNVPFVVINQGLDDSEINQVMCDDFGAGRMGVQHFASLGHTRIATFCGPLNDPLPWHSAQERHRGWRQTMLENKLPVHEKWIIKSSYSYEGGYQAGLEFLQTIKNDTEKPTAIFVANDTMGVGALKALLEAGLRIPQDIALVAVGDPPHMAFTYPAMTALELPIMEAGRVGARILVNWIRKGKPEYAQRVLLSCKLKVRESCGAYLLKGPDAETEDDKLQSA
jgi:LacI family transcriptional regulator